MYYFNIYIIYFIPFGLIVYREIIYSDTNKTKYFSKTVKFCKVKILSHTFIFNAIQFQTSECFDLM